MSEFVTPSVDHPDPRNLSSELDQIYQANQRQAGPYYQLESQYSPLYNRLNLSNLTEQTQGWTDADGTHHPGTLELGRAATADQRQQDISDVETLGPRSTEAYLNANPMLRRSLGLLGDRETDSRLLTSLNDRALGGGSPILQSLNQSAEQGLAAGGALSPQDIRAIEQASRSGFSDRGTLNGNNSLVTEVLNRDAASRARLAAAQQFATGVQGLNQAQDQFATGVQGANQAQNDFTGRASQIFSTTVSDPYMALLNRASGAGGAASLTPIGSGSRIFDPFNPYAQDLFNTNFNEEASRGYANATAQANTRSAIASIAGGSFAGLGSDMRMKENIREIPGREVELESGTIPRFSFTYRAGCVPRGYRGDKTYIGVMADDVEMVMPGAVSVDPETGFKRVNYGMLGIEMEELV